MYKRNQVFIAACIGLFLFGMTLITLGSILPALKIKFETKEMNAGILSSLLPIGILVGSLLFGPIVDRRGYKLLLIISILLSAIGLEGLAFTNSLSLLYGCFFLIGFVGGIINGGANALVADISAENKGANLSLLGVSFGIGALGMPLLLGLLSKYFDYTVILSAVGFFMVLPVIYISLIIFPIPKQVQGVPLNEGVKLLKESALLLISFYLFFQSGIEALVNNWTTSFLQEKIKMSNEDALLTLSFYLVGLTIARLLLGGVLKKISSFLVMIISLLLVIAGNSVLILTDSSDLVFAALIITGMGLAAGFPVMLGYVGQLFSKLSGTAFSIALVIALIGNTLLNYFFSIIADKYSIGYLPETIIVCVICMTILLIATKQKISSKIKL